MPDRITLNHTRVATPAGEGTVVDTMSSDRYFHVSRDGGRSARWFPASECTILDGGQ